MDIKSIDTFHHVNIFEKFSANCLDMLLWLLTLVFFDKGKKSSSPLSKYEVHILCQSFFSTCISFPISVSVAMTSMYYSLSG